MDPIDQQNQDAISKVSLKHTVEANAHAIEVFRRESAEICLKMKEHIHQHQLALSQFFSTLLKIDKNENNFEQVRTELDNTLLATNEFYDKEHIKCCHSLKETSFINTEEHHPRLEDALDQQIKRYL